MPYNLKDFPADEDLARIAKEDEWFRYVDSETGDFEGDTDRGKWLLEQFFENDTKKGKLLSRAMNVAPLICDAGTDFLFGEPYRVTIDTKDGQKPPEETMKKIHEFEERNKLQERMSESSTLFQGIGHAHFKVFKDASGKAVVQEIPYSYWFPNWEGVAEGAETQNVLLVTYITRTDDSGKKEYFVYIEDWFMEKKKCIIEYALYKEKPGGKIDDPVDLALLNMTPPGAKKQVTKNAGGQEVIKYRKDTGFDELPLVTVDHWKTVRHRYGQSILKRIRHELTELNDRLTQLSIQFVKHLNAVLQLPEGAVTVDANGKIQVNDIEVIFARAGEAEAKYITNDNPLIEDAFKHIENTLRSIAKITQTPDKFILPSETGGVEQVEALKIHLIGFLKRIKRYQRKYEAAILKLYRLGLKIEGVKESLPLKVVFDIGLPKDWEVDGTVWGDALANGLASRETAVSRFQDLEDDELKAELQRIDKEEQERAKSNAEALAAAGVGGEPEEE